jgi:hypothetical protein
MKTNIIASSITIILIVLCILFAGCTDDGISGLNPASTSKYTLSEAVDNGLIKAKITGSGASSGDSVNLELIRLTSERMEITVPKGMVLIASDESQNMVVNKVSGIPEDSKWIIPVSEIILDSSDPQTYILEAYCLDFHKNNPGSNTRFSIETVTDPEIQSILDALDNLSQDITTVEAIQTAIWISTDDLSKEELLDKFSVDQKEIDNARTILEEAGIDTTFKLFFR